MKKELIDNNYFVVKNFLSENDAQTLAKNFKLESQIHSYVDEVGYIGKLNDFSSLKILCQKLNVVSELVEEELLPTYSFTRIYRPGDSLPRHLDRNTCEISLTVNLNCHSNWPIFIKDPEGNPHSVILLPGDAMVYLGTIAEHWRDINPTNNEYTQMFLHYVRYDGICRDFYFNNPQSIPRSYESTIISKLKEQYRELR